MDRSWLFTSRVGRVLGGICSEWIAGDSSGFFRLRADIWMISQRMEEGFLLGLFEGFCEGLFVSRLGVGGWVGGFHCSCFSFFIFIFNFSYFCGVFMIIFQQVSITTPYPPSPSSTPPPPLPPSPPPTPGVGFPSAAQRGGKLLKYSSALNLFFFFFFFFFLSFSSSFSSSSYASSSTSSFAPSSPPLLLSLLLFLFLFCWRRPAAGQHLKACGVVSG